MNFYPEQIEIERIKKVYRIYRRKSHLKKWWDNNSPANRFIFSQREKLIINILKESDMLLPDKRILDIGCGNGAFLFEFTKYGIKSSNLYGIDILEERINEARKRYPGINFLCQDASRLDFPDSSFDMIFAFTVFSSVLSRGVSYRLAREMTRLVKKDGLIFIYDVRYLNLFNPYTRRIDKKLLTKLFPEMSIQSYPVTLIPHICHLLIPFSAKICYVLERVPFLCSHYLTVVTK